MNINEWVTSDIGHRFTGDAFRELCGPMVYLFSKNGKALYVGMSGNGLSRAACRRHAQADRARMECDEVMTWSCKDKASAKRLEEYLIHKLRPIFNQNKRTTYIERLLGCSKDSPLLA